MKHIAIITVAVLAAGAFAKADWAPDPEYLVRRDMKFFEGKTPVQIARFLGHPNGIPYAAAVRSLAAHGDEALGLLKKLLSDTNPWIRAGAIDTLGEIYKVKGDGSGKGNLMGKMTPELKAVLDRLAPLVGDPHPAVQNAMGSFVEKTRLETAATRKIILTMAASDAPDVRMKTLRMARYWLKDPNTVVKLCTLVSAAPAGNTPSHYNLAHMIIARYRKSPVCRQAIGAMAAFLRNKANTVPFRGFFSDGAQLRALEVMQAQWDDEVEAMPDVVPGIARCYVRVPIHPYPGWVKTRSLALKLLEGLKPSSVEVLRAAIAREKKWLATAANPQILAVSERKSPESKPVLAKNIKTLEELADELEAKGK